jgi:sugar lactone lactonase YvrE
MERIYGTITAAGLVLVLGIGVIASPRNAAAENPAWRVGDVFIGTDDGSYQVFDRHGGFKHLLRDERGGYTTDCGFNPSLDKLYTTNYTHSKVVVFDDEAQHDILQTVHSGETSPRGHSSALVFDADGNLFVGHPDGNHLIHKYNDTGMLLEAFEVAVEERGTSGIDLAADQRTLFYTSEGRMIQRFDTAANTQLEDFAELPGEGPAFALRLLPPGDGSGGLLVADEAQIKRLDGNGQVVQTYDAAGQDAWFALNLDPNGTSFWAADSETDQLYRFHIATGAIEQQFRAGPGNTIFGVCLKGELTAGVSQAETVLPGFYSLAQNAPNPFNPSTQIEYQLPESGEVRLVIYNLLGQQIRTLVQGAREAGIHRVGWNGQDGYGRAVSSGLYLYRFESEGLVQTRRMVLLK